MKAKNLFILSAIALMAASCSTGKDNNTATDDAAEEAFASTPYTGSIAGEWKIMDIEMYDTLSIDPAEITPDQPQTVMFTDSTYHFQTNCNLVQGDYTRNGDSISFAPGLATRMACPDMRVENALTQLLPQLTGIGMDNDSTLRLTAGNPSAYILLKKL